MKYDPVPNTDFLTLKAVQHRYGISRATIYSWVAAKILPKPVKLGPRAVRFRAADLAAFEAQFAAGAPAHATMAQAKA